MKMKLAAMAAIGFAALVGATQAAQAAVTTVDYDITATGGTISPNPLEADVQITWDQNSISSVNGFYIDLLSNNFGATDGLSSGSAFAEFAGTELLIFVGPYQFNLDAGSSRANLFNPTSDGAVNSFDNSVVTHSGSVTASIVSAAPEPATWALMLLGVGFAGGALRMRRRDTRGLVSA